MLHSRGKVRRPCCTVLGERSCRLAVLGLVGTWRARGSDPEESSGKQLRPAEAMGASCQHRPLQVTEQWSAPR